jgi:hypothetical protein
MTDKQMTELKAGDVVYRYYPDPKSLVAFTIVEIEPGTNSKYPRYWVSPSSTSASSSSTSYFDLLSFYSLTASGALLLAIDHLGSEVNKLTYDLEKAQDALQAAEDFQFELETEAAAIRAEGVECHRADP